MFNKIITLSSLIIFSLLGDGLANERVRLQLKWKHQFQSAGYYAALEKRYYQAAGLDVEIIEAKEGKTPADEVITGKAEYGVAMSDLITLRAQGFPVVALAVIYQHSPLVLLSPQNNKIDNVHELKGRRIALEPHAEELLAYFESEGLPSDKITMLPHDYGISSLISGQVDAISAYSTDEPFMLKELGMEYNILSPRSGGIDFYGDTLFTTREQIEKNPKQVIAFLEASLKGWEYALKNSDEIIDLILSKYTQRHSRDHLMFEARMSKKLIMADVVELGYMNPGRWEHIAEIFKKLNTIPSDFSLKGFIHDKNPEPDYTILYFIFITVAAISIIAFFLTARFYKLNKNLKYEMNKRQGVQKKLTMLMSNLPGIAYQCLNDENYTMKFISKGCKVLTGYEVDELIENKNKSYSELIHPDDIEKITRAVKDAVSIFSPFKIEYRIIDKQNKVKWVWEQGQGIYAQDNSIEYIEGFITDISKQKYSELQREKLVSDLQSAMTEIKALGGLLPICAHCKKIRDDKGYWNQLEDYIQTHSDAQFSHSICKECAEKHYPNMNIYDE